MNSFDGFWSGSSLIPKFVYRGEFS